MKNLDKLKRAMVATSLLLATATSFAQQQSVSIGDIQNAANRSGDKSMSILETMFGPVVHNPLAAGSGASGMIAQMFLVLNSCVLAVGVIWAMYQGTTALIATGQDGEFMGQKKSSPWFVIRMGAGFTGLLPAFGGFSGVQMVMLWGTMIGVGIANLTMAAAVSFLNTGGSMIATPAAPPATTLAKALFEANLCAQSANTAIANMPNDTGVSVDPAERFSPIQTGTKVVMMNQLGLSCGGAEIDLTAPPSIPSYDGMAVYSVDPNAAYSRMLTAHQNALTVMQSTLFAAAQTYVSAINGQTQPTDPGSTINQAALQYQATITQAISNSSSAINGLASVIQSNLQRDGWLMMGSWYQTFAQANSQLSSLAGATAAAVPGTGGDNMPYPTLYRKVSAVYSQQLQQDASVTTTQGALDNLATGITGTDPKSIIGKIFNAQGLVKWAVNLNSGQGPAGSTNPLIGMKNLGDYILDAGWTALGGYAGVQAALGAKDSLIGKAAEVVTGGISGLVGGMGSGLMKALGPFIVMLVITLFFFGATLSIYIPMLPFMVWFGGLVGWFAVVCESLVASPLWAFAHLDGEGEGMGQRTTHGYIFLLNVMFRPVFMIFGFVFGGAGVVVLGTLLNTMFGVALANAQFDSTTGLVSIIGFIVLYVSMCLSLVNGAFSLIHVIPDQVFAWIGGQMTGAVGRDMPDKADKNFGAGLNQGANVARSQAPTMLGGSGAPTDPKDAGRISRERV
ncbi:DotA/TraY family protein [Paraburkholderia sp. BCC1876]|uniref:DotA/TraY family protein n=1 Tax=Paraburkholderia sp. BCC1876 TaxID=2676303 RepID=UPI0015900FE1|nr:DotA/TraY family protein [Paraburkholderia sp. BCC1876]